MRKFILIGLLIPMTVIGQKTLEYYSGVIANSTTWKSDTIILDGNLSIPDSVVISIIPGVKVLIKGSHEICVYGHIRAMGAPSRPIIFQPIDTAGFGSSTYPIVGWRGIRFINEPAGVDSSILQYCHIGFTRNSLDIQDVSAGILLMGRNRIRISNSLIHRHYSLVDGGGIACIKSSPLILGNTIMKNESGRKGAGIYLLDCASPKIQANVITLNQSKEKGGGICSIASQALILGNTITSNRCESPDPAGGGHIGDGGAIYVYDTVSGVEIINNKIIGNWSPGAALHEATMTSSLIGNLITNNGVIGVLCGNSISQSRYINNTICNNLGMGVLLTSAYQKWYNCIVWDNGSTGNISNVVIALDTPWMYFSDLQFGYPGPGLGNISGNPIFTAPSTYKGLHPTAWTADWGLQHQSPCVNQGMPDAAMMGLPATDLFGNQRIQGGRIDMGAIETDASQGIAMKIHEQPWGLHPNPGREAPMLLMEEGRRISLIVTDILGHIVYEGQHSNRDLIPLNRIKPGIYLCCMRQQGQIQHVFKWIKEN